MTHRYAPATSAPKLLSLPFTGLRSAFADGYGPRDLRADVLAGLVVGVVALPLSMALAIAVGVPPQHGLYTAIVAGAMAGAILLAMGLFRLGRLIQFIPHPVTTGFTAGIGTVIGVLQLKDLLGLLPKRSPDHFAERVHALWDARGTASLPELAIGLGTLLLLVLLPRLSRRIPSPLVALPAAAVAGVFLHRYGLDVATIGSRFHAVIDGVRVDGIPRLPPLPLKPWSLPPELPLRLQTLRVLLPSALAIALLGAIESLLSAVVADGMAGTKHDPDAELLALGVGNLVCPFFGGIAATGAIARTATGIRYGSRSPISTVVHAVVVLAAVLALAPLISYLPMAALAALLLLVAWNMSEAKHFFHMIRVAPKSDVAVLLTCYFLTVVFDMVIAVTAGMVLAAFLFMRRMAEVASVQLVEEGHPHLKVKLPKLTVLYEVNGPLFFGAAEMAMDAFKAIGARMRVLILNMSAVPAMDITGLVALESALLRLRQQGVLTLVTGVRPQPEGVLKKAGVLEEPGRVQFCATLEEAAQVAAAHVGGRPVLGTA